MGRVRGVDEEGGCTPHPHFRVPPTPPYGAIRTKIALVINKEVIALSCPGHPPSSFGHHRTVSSTPPPIKTSGWERAIPTPAYALRIVGARSRQYDWRPTRRACRNRKSDVVVTLLLPPLLSPVMLTSPLSALAALVANAPMAYLGVAQAEVDRVAEHQFQLASVPVSVTGESPVGLPYLRRSNDAGLSRDDNTRRRA